MVVVHHLNNSRSQRVLWLLEETGVPYRVQRYQRDAKTMLAPPELRRVHPLGKSPVIEDAGEVIAESGAIIEYLAGAYGSAQSLVPAANTPEARRYRYWLHYAEGSAMPPLVLSLIFSRLPKGPMPFVLRPLVKGIADKVLKTFVNPQLRTHFDYIESELAQRRWFAGEEFTAADIQMSFPLEAAAARGAINERHPHARAWLARIHARPAYARALEQGGPFELLR